MKCIGLGIQHSKSRVQMVIDLKFSHSIQF
jgi:hypothetical protein